MSCLSVLPANVVQLTGTPEKETVMNAETVQGLQGIKDPECKFRDVPAVGLDTGIYSGKGINGSCCFIVTVRFWRAETCLSSGIQ
jgi:hypothetical protein